MHQRRENNEITTQTPADKRAGVSLDTKQAADQGSLLEN